MYVCVCVCGWLWLVGRNADSYLIIVMFYVSEFTGFIAGFLSEAAEWRNVSLHSHFIVFCALVCLCFIPAPCTEWSLYFSQIWLHKRFHEAHLWVIESFPLEICILNVLGQQLIEALWSFP